MWGYTVLVCIVNVKKNGTFCVNWKALYSIIFGNQYILCRFGIQNSLCCYGKPCFPCCLESGIFFCRLESGTYRVIWKDLNTENIEL